MLRIIKSLVDSLSYIISRNNGKNKQNKPYTFILLPASFYVVHNSEPKNALRSVCVVSSGVRDHNESFQHLDRKSKRRSSSRSLLLAK